jgi:SH3-like domain-containing protein
MAVTITKIFNRSLMLLLSLLFSLFLCSPICAKMLTIAADKVNIRSGPGEKYDILFQVGSGYPVVEVERKGKWYKVKDFEQDTGWVHESLLTNTPQLIVNTNKGSDETINIREKPLIKADIVGKAHYGVVFKKLKEEKGWAQVQHSSGLTGWIKRNLLWGY